MKMRRSTDIAETTSLAANKVGIRFWVVLNVVLTFFMLLGNIIILGAMQQMYSRMIAVQKVQVAYDEKYSKILNYLENKDGESVDVGNIRNRK